MQVSWINPEDVASLAESLRAPARRAPVPADEPGLSLLEPEDLAALTEALEDFGMEPRQPEAAEAQSPAAEVPLPKELHMEEAPVEEAPAEKETAPIMQAPPAPVHEGGPDLNALRQRLQEIRERAVDAGLLPAPQAVVPRPEVSIAAQPQTQADDAPPPAPLAAAAPASAPRIPRPTVFEVPLGSVMARLEAFALWARGCLGTDDLFVVDDRGDLLWGPQDQAGLILSTLMAVNAAARASAWSACEESRVIHHTLPSGMVATIIPCVTRLGMIQVTVSAAEALTPEEPEMVRNALVAAMDAEELEPA